MGVVFLPFWRFIHIVCCRQFFMGYHSHLIDGATISKSKNVEDKFKKALEKNNDKKYL